jgi:phosphopantetheinyl transferase
LFGNEAIEKAAIMGISMLDDDEKNRYNRYRPQHRKLQFAASRWLVRTHLSWSTDDATTDWHLATDLLGRPIAYRGKTFYSHYSLSHSHGCIASVLHPYLSVGVDIEHLARTFSKTSLAIGFTESELKLLDDAPESEWLIRWTIKEAIAKQTGQVGLNSIAKICTSHVRTNDRINPVLFDCFGCMCLPLDVGLTHVGTIAISMDSPADKPTVLDAASWMSKE